MTELRRLKIKNFKSLEQVDIEFSHLNVLVGMNGAGKSTVLQALDFVSQLMRGRIDDWLAAREWRAADLNCKLTSKNNIEIEATVILDDGIEMLWEAHFNRNKLNCTYERILCNESQVFMLKNGYFHQPFEKKPLDIFYEYEGSIFSNIKFRHDLNDRNAFILTMELRDFFRSFQSLELLSPNLMREPAKITDQGIGTGGEKLSAFLDSLKENQQDLLLKLLQTFYPQAVDFKILNHRSGWKRLTIIEQFGEHRLETEARHMNDGLLRILAILAQTQTAPSMLLLDEIENGVNQELVEKLVKVLLEAKTQIVVTTHSPLILNYLPDEIAKDSVQFIYKSPQGTTQIRRFFEIPRIASKLNMMGAGDAFVDTNLIELANECSTLDQTERAVP